MSYFHESHIACTLHRRIMSLEGTSMSYIYQRVSSLSVDSLSRDEMDMPIM